MQQPILHGSPRSPFVRKVRIVLVEKEVPYAWSTDYYGYLHEVNPLGKVPVLVTPDSETIYDSRVICEYLEVLRPEPRLIPGTGRQRLDVKRWEALADGICDAAVCIVNERARENLSTESVARIEMQRQKIVRGIAAASSQLGPNKWCCQGQITLADVALVTALDYVNYRVPEVDWMCRHPNLETMKERLANRQSFLETAPR